MDDSRSAYYYTMSCNSLSTPYTECLHDAILQNSMKKLDRLLRRNNPRVNLNCKNFFGDTPLFTSLRARCCDDFVMKLIDAGCNTNETNEKCELPLHWAVRRRSILIAHELIKRGTNVNVMDELQQTPLRHALRHGFMPSIHLLLYYGTDVTNIVAIPEDLSPNLDRNKIAVLLNSFQKFSFARDRSNLYERDFAVTLRTYPYGVYSSHNVPLAYYAIGYCSDQPFYVIWSQLNHQVLLNNTVPFLLVYIRKCRFPPSKWLEVLYALLQSPSGANFIKDFRSSRYCETWNFALVPELLMAMHERQIALQERVAVISLCLSLGATVDISEVNWVIQKYGFCDEVDSLIQAVTYHIEFWILEQPAPLTVYALALDSPNMKPIYKLLKEQVRATYEAEDVVRALGYFSLPSAVKESIAELCEVKYGACPPRVCDKLSDIPEVPSLLELSRNMARTYVKYNYEVHIPRQFHAVVDKLPLPNIVKNIIRFKVPLY